MKDGYHAIYKCSERNLTDRNTITALDLLVVDPMHQRRGAGTMLVKWGVDIADNMGVKVCVFCFLVAHATLFHIPVSLPPFPLFFTRMSF